jgi:solute carrier family 35 protein E3
MADTNLYKIVIALTLNIAASCGTIFINKIIFKSYDFTFGIINKLKLIGTALTVGHFIVTFFLVLLTSSLGLFQIKKLEILRVLPLSFAFCGYVVFNNISLLYNSVSFYQVMKILGTPVIIFIEYYFYNKETSNNTKLSLIPVCVGIFITVVTDIEINTIGTIYAVLAIGSNSIYTIVIIFNILVGKNKTK